MTNPFLERERANDAPKCANCNWWAGRDSELASVAECELHHIKTLDLAKCQAHRPHEVHVGQIIEGDQ